MKKAILLTGLFLLLVGGAKATMMLSLNIEQLSDMATIVIKGKVTNIKSQQEQNKIVAYVTVKVDEWIKGAPSSGDTFIFNETTHFAGNRLDNESLRAKYTVGKDYIFFLQDEGGPIGLQQGVFEIQDGKIKNFENRKSHLFRKMDVQNNENPAIQHSLSENPDSDSVQQFIQLIKSL